MFGMEENKKLTMVNFWAIIGFFHIGNALWKAIWLEK